MTRKFTRSNLFSVRESKLPKRHCWMSTVLIPLLMPLISLQMPSVGTFTSVFQKMSFVFCNHSEANNTNHPWITSTIANPCQICVSCTRSMNKPIGHCFFFFSKLTFVSFVFRFPLLFILCFVFSLRRTYDIYLESMELSLSSSRVICLSVLTFPYLRTYFFKCDSNEC